MCIRDRDYVVYPYDVLKVVRKARQDTAEEKRVELHLHTKLSSMDGFCDPKAAVKMAHRMGHRAVAITDHGVVQGYPEAMLAVDDIHKKDPDFKLIYGCEAYFVDDMVPVVYGKDAGPLEQSFVVFDLETTGPVSYTHLDVYKRQLWDYFPRPRRHPGPVRQRAFYPAVPGADPVGRGGALRRRAMAKCITLLGSTGSIGTQSLDVARAEGYTVCGLAAHSNTDLLLRQIAEFHPAAVAVTQEAAARRMDAALEMCIRDRCPGGGLQKI